MISLEDYTIEDISQYLPKYYDKSNHKLVTCSSNTVLITVGEAKNYKDREVLLDSNKYKIVGVGTYALGDESEIRSFDLIVKLIQKMY